MRSLQVEDDAHRVLQLVRAQRTLSKARAKTPNGKSSSATHKASRSDGAESPGRHRHVHTATKQPVETLVQVKTQALMAVYGLRTAEPTKLHTKEAGDQESPSKGSLAEATRRELLETRRRIYRKHFSGLQATYGPSGRPKLETLIDAAVDAKRSCCKHSSLAIGAAVLTSANRIYASGRLESAQDAKFDVCAERATLLKLLERQQQSSSLQQIEVVEAMVICSDQRGLLPMPCGSCREFLAEFGDFPVFLLNAENDSQETRSFELFPHARHSDSTAMSVQAAAHDQPRDAKRTPTSNTNNNNRPIDVRDWSCEHVAAWLSEVVELPQYTGVVIDKRVDGATLWHLQDSDLQLLLGIVQPLHRRRVLTHIDRLKDRELLEHGIDFGQLEDYLAVLDRDRMDVVAQLKATFDRLDQNKDGFLDFAELKSALRELDLDIKDDGTSASSMIATDQLLQSIASAGGSGSDKVSFPVFVKAFSQLAQLPAGEVRDASTGNANGVPSGVDLVSLRATFDRADTNKSGSIDENELVSLLQSLGRDNCQTRAKEWFQAVDGNGDGRLSFAEFFLRYAQLTKLDLTTLRTVFDSEGKGQWRSIPALERALHRLFPHVATADIKTWYHRRPWLDEVDTEKKTLTFAEFALACVMYSNALQLRVAQLRKMQQALQNDALCHRSRIVHLQQSGHVRLCRHPGGDAADDEEEERSLGEKRRRSHTPTTRRSRNNGEESKGGEEDEDDEGHEEDEAVTAFRRFAIATKRKATSHDTRHRRDDDDDDDSKQQSDEDEEDEELRLNAVEAAQALMELGIVCSRDQLLRYLDREGFGLRRSLTKREFVRIFKRLKVFQAVPRGLKAAEKEKKQRELWDAIGRAASGRLGEKVTTVKANHVVKPGQKHANRRDYDEYLRSKHKQQRGRRRSDDDDGGKEDSDEEEDTPRRDRRRTVELRRSRSQRRRSSSSSSASSSSSRRGRSRSRRVSRSHSQRRRDSSSTSTASSTDSSHRSPTRRGRSQTPFFRGFEVGDRVSSRSQGTGTLVRLYRDYFVADVHFDSGERAKNVELSHLRRVTESQDRSQRATDKLKRKALVVGACVRVAHKGTKTAFRKGTILRCRTDGSYDVVANEHGEQELLQRVPFGQIVLAGKPVVYSEGQRVTVKRKHEYLRGSVELCRTNGTYDVRVKGQGTTRVMKELAWELLAPDDNTGGDEEVDEDEDAMSTKKAADASRLRREKRREEEEEDDGKYDEDEDGGDAFEPEFSKGDRVEARFQGQAAYYGGRITRVHSDSACDVAYDDGDSETRVPSRFIRAVSAAKSKPASQAKADAYEDDFDSD